MWGRRFIIGTLVWIMLSAQASEPVERNQGQPSNRAAVGSNPREHQSVPGSVRRGENAPVAETEKSNADEDRKRADSDLQAQWQMAQWTMIMGLVAVGALILSVTGVWLVFLTFRETRKAAKSATDTYQAFVNVERARVVVTLLGVNSFAEQIVTIPARFTNIGKSGATVLGSRYWALEGVEFPSEFPAQVIANTPLLPGGVETGTVAYFNLREIEQTPFVGGYVEYSTALGTTHRSYFLTMIGPRDGGTSPGFDLQGHPYVNREGRKRFGWPDDT